MWPVNRETCIRQLKKFILDNSSLNNSDLTDQPSLPLPRQIQPRDIVDIDHGLRQ